MLTKKEYITNQFRKTFGKKYENYCITRIYSLINNMDVRVVTQQLFKRGNDDIALADLYFPQLNIWVEIDEYYHSKQEEEDKKRVEEVIKNNKLNRLEEVISITTLEEPIRINVGLDKNKNDISIEDINKQIDFVVKKVNEKIEDLGNKFIPWTCVYKSPLEYRNKLIKFEDNVKFRTIKECTEIFEKMNKKYKQQCAWFNIKDNTYLWCPKLDLIENENIKCNWENKISIDGTTIYESSRKGHKDSADSLNWNELRITFPYYKDENDERMYKFRGVFKLDKNATEKLNYEKRVWKRISTEINLNDYSF